jgi:hypothetical protein
MTGKSLDQVVNWFIIALMLVFDPLAIALVVAANFVFEYVSIKRKEEEERRRNERIVEEVLDEIEELEEKIEGEESKFIIGEAPIPPAIEESVIEEEKIEDVLEDSYFIDDYAVEEEPQILEEPVIEPIEEVIAEPVVEEEPTVEEEIAEPAVEEQPVEEEVTETIVEEPAVEEVTTETVEDTAPQEPREDGEFGGYRLGNVYKDEPKPRKQVFDEEQHSHNIDHPASSNPTILN